MQSVFFILGLLICGAAILQFALWSTIGLRTYSANKKQFAVSQELLREKIREHGKSRKVLDDGHWQGYRWFRVAKLVQETEICTSVYLQPEDGKPICSFRPGQHLTFKFQIPGEAKPVIRCYSLSDSPQPDHYRITVKKNFPPADSPNLPAGKASSFINETLMVGDRLEVKAPSGKFFLDEDSDSPVVLLAGGIGITPMISMINRLLSLNSERSILLLYGVTHGADQAFRNELRQLANDHHNFHLVSCFSHPRPADVLGTDYEVAGFASVDLLRKLLPDPRCLFYLCGPPPFMTALYDGLIEWGVPGSRINYEAFGPASIGKARNKPTTQPRKRSQASNVVL